MKLKHRYLEQVRRTPSAAISLSESSNQGMGKTMVRVWDHAVSKFHNTQDANSAIDYLENGILEFKPTKEREKRLKLYLENMKEYIDDYQKLGFQNIKTLAHLNIDITHNNYVTGEIFRIDKTPENGFAITILNRDNSIWAGELRFRLLQIHFSNKYKCPYDLIKVGVYNFISKTHEYTSFDDGELKQAWEEVTDISTKINQFQL